MLQKTFHSEHFINRELSYLEFNSRVLEEAEDTSNPLLERVKFLAIFSSNMDEFFMIRVAGLREQAFGAGAPEDKAADGMSSLAQLKAISRRTRELIDRQYRCWNKSVLPSLRENGVVVLQHDEIDGRQRQRLDRFFENTASLVLTPMAIDPSHPSPHFHNQGLYLAAQLDRRKALGPKRLFAVIQLPAVLPRLVPLGSDGEPRFVFLEEVVASRLPELFGGYDVAESTTFRITRDNDLELLDKEADDMLHLIEERIRARRRAEAVRLEVPTGANKEFVRFLIEDEEIRVATESDPGAYSEVYYVPGPLDLSSLMVLLKIENSDQLRDSPFTPRPPRRLRRRNGDGLFNEIARNDVLLHHPYESFDPVVNFVISAANDPKVLAIKQTLYRTSGDSPIVRALIQAAENGKQVTALVELKARFDEAANVHWAREMERAGVHVVFGFLDLKTHCKLSIVIRREADRLKRYVHLSTGNYHPATAKMYTDLGLFTADEDMAADVSALFNLLTGYSQGHPWRKLVVAPNDLHLRTMELIENQAERALAGKPARIFAKLNALVDQRVIEALYRASQAGVPIELVVRGICCLRPGMPGISESIVVRSIVDRFLEHTRIFAFGPTERARVFLSSADWMPRNFVRRVEVMFPIEDEELRQRILQEIIPAYLGDNVKARILRSHGSYERATPQSGEAPFRSQQELLHLHENVPSDEGSHSPPTIGVNATMADPKKWIDDTSPGQPISQVARRSVSGRLDVVWKYVPLAAQRSGENTEYVHQVRVAARRAAVALDLFAPSLPRRRTRRMKKHLRKIRRAAGDARNLDVLMQMLARSHQNDHLSDDHLLQITRVIHALRRKAQKPILRLYKHLNDKGFPRKARRLAQRIRWRFETDEPNLGSFTRQGLKLVADEFFAQHPLEPRNMSQLHTLRICGKRLRYAIELLAGGVDSTFRRDLYPMLTDLQDRLGIINDHVMASSVYGKWIDQSRQNESLLADLVAHQDQQLDRHCEILLDWWSPARILDFQQRFYQILGETDSP